MALEDYKAVFGDQFDNIVDAIMKGGLTPQVEAMIVGTIDEMVFNVNIFSENINKTVTNMTKAGISKDVIRNTLQQDMKGGGKIFGRLRNETRETLVGGINKSGALAQYETYLNNGITEDSLFTWVTASGHRICADCLALSGGEKTFKEWESSGLPGAGHTVCGGYCYCVVDPVGKMDKEVKVNTEAIKKEKGASKSGSILDRVFKSPNKKGNEIFKKAFNTSNNKFKTFISKMPPLQHIGTGGGRSAYYTQSTRSPFLQSIDGKPVLQNEKYFFKHGGINIKHTVRGVNNVTRHEYGHYLHQNLNHFSDWYSTNQWLKMYDASIGKIPMNEFLDNTERIWGVVANGRKIAESHLKFYDAWKASQKRLGVPLRGKAAKELNKQKNRFYKELDIKTRYKSKGKGEGLKYWKEVYGEKDFKTGKTWDELYDNIPSDNPLLKSLIDNADDLSENGYDGLMLQDLMGSITKEKVGYGHGVSYYSKGGVQMQMHETFANLTAIYNNPNQIYWKFISDELPELAKYYDDLINDVNTNGYFGRQF